VSCFVADTGAHAQLITACLAASTFQLSGVNEAVERHTTSVCDFLWIRRMCRIQKRSKRRALCMDTAVELNDTGYLAFGCDRAWVFSSIATDRPLWMTRLRISFFSKDKKHLKNVGPIRYCKPPHAHSPDVASGTVARRLRIDVHDNDDNDNAWQRGPLWPIGMGPKTWFHDINTFKFFVCLIVSAITMWKADIVAWFIFYAVRRPHRSR